MLQRCALALVAGSLVVLACAQDAHAQASLVTGLGGPRGYGTSCMPPNDDGAWPGSGTTGLDITPAFPTGLHFYSGSYTAAWVNNNGNLSFGGALSTYTPSAFPGAPQPMIAPYWADVDTRSGAECTDSNYPSGSGYPAGATCTSGPDYSTSPTANGVWWAMSPGQMVVTWDQVGYFSCHTTPVMSFQMILSKSACGAVAEDGGVPGANFDIMFRYNQCGWEAGDASGGTNGFCPAGGGTSCTPAQAGFDSAETPDVDYASLPLSRQNGVGHELCTDSNLTPKQAGVWVFKVRGGQILCPTAGQPCQTGIPGVCAAGQLTCGVNGTTTCQPLTSPQPSQCNGFDNNCDGTIDTGPCPAGTVCDGTACVPICGEVGCATGQVCSNGLCVPASCVGVTCTGGQVCENGQCVDPCTGVTCPIGQVCRVGKCVDPCAGLNCGSGQVCENGACVPTCPCTACDSTHTCVTTGTLAGQCVETDCATVSCQPGTVCQSGSCVDACTGAVCPAGQLCQAGNCVQNNTPPDAGPGIVLTIPDASTGVPITLEDGGILQPGAGDDGGAGNGFAESKVKGGCGCRVTVANGGGGVAVAAGLGVAALLIGRRRRRR